MNAINKNVIVDAIKKNMVPIIFTILCILSIYYSRQPFAYILTETVARIGRNAILILSLLLPVMCGMGLNFSIVLGAMAGEIGLILITHWSMDGLSGIGISVIIATILSIIFGVLTGQLFNKTKGQEMITGMILGFFAVGVYDLIFIFMVGSIIPMKNPEIMLAEGIGLRNTIEFHEKTKYAVDKVLKLSCVTLIPYLLMGFAVVSIVLVLFKMKKYKMTFKQAMKAIWKWIVTTAIFLGLQILTLVNIKVKFALSMVQIPMLTVFAIVLVCCLIVFITRTKLGQDIRTVGQNIHVATAAAIKVDKVRIISVVLSTVIASWGQIIFLQNMGNVNTYNSHEQVGTYAVAALLVGGASINRATMAQVFTGTVLFHILFFVSPLAGKNLFNDSMIGEYFRVFLCYGVIGISLVLYAWKRVMSERQILEKEAEEKINTITAKESV
ncbi:ABC transporter permease [Clostridiaceae bacterium 35-E11]